MTTVTYREWSTLLILKKMRRPLMDRQSVFLFLSFLCAKTSAQHQVFLFFFTKVLFIISTIWTPESDINATVPGALYQIQSLSWHQFKYHYIRIKYKVWHQASLFQCSKISSYLSSCDINQSIIVPGWHWSLPCCPWPRSFPLLSLQTAPGWKLKKKLCFLFKVGSGAPGNWLDTFAMLTECTDAKFCNTTAQVTKVKKCYKKITYFFIRKTHHCPDIKSKKAD